MNKKGFTLIELLAVIVILAIIALIATPIVLNVIGQAQEGADARSVEAYAKTIETQYYATLLNDPSATLEGVAGTITTADYNGAEVKCTEVTEVTVGQNKKVSLTGCSVDTRGTYTYANGRATKD